MKHLYKKVIHAGPKESLDRKLAELETVYMVRKVRKLKNVIDDGPEANIWEITLLPRYLDWEFWDVHTGEKIGELGDNDLKVGSKWAKNGFKFTVIQRDEMLKRLYLKVDPVNNEVAN